MSPLRVIESESTLIASAGFAKTWTQSDAIAEADEKNRNALSESILFMFGLHNFE